MYINNINTADISFVVQGAVDKKYTNRCLDSIRNNFPGSEIILSTWRDTDVKYLDFDRIVYSEDCGAAVCDTNGTINNLNRQIVSTNAGLNIVQTKFVVKCRSDLLFESPEFLYYFSKFNKFDDKYKVCNQRLIVLNLWTRLFFVHPVTLEIMNSGPHVSDWFTFGLTEDVKKFYDVQLIPDIGEFSGYWLRQPEKIAKLPFPNLLLRETPEQYFSSNFFGMETEDDILKLSNIPLEQVCKFLVNNFIVLDYAQSKIYCQKWESWSKNIWNMPADQACTFVNHGEFLNLYKKYCDQDLNDKQTARHLSEYKRNKIRNMLDHFLYIPIKQNIKKFLSRKCSY